MNASHKGRHFEHEIRELFRQGYSVIRGAGSEGEMLQEKVDLIATKETALNEYKVLLTLVGVQCKARRKSRSGCPHYEHLM